MSKRPVLPNDCTATSPIAMLPFVSLSSRGKPHCWTVPPVGGPVDDYVEAEAIGREYATQFTHWLQANPELVGMGVLGWIAADIDFKNDEHSGYWVGFFSCIERRLFDTGAAT